MKYFIKKNAYTLIELVIVVIIIALLAGIAIPAIGNLIRNSKIKATEKEINQLVKAIVGDSDLGVLGYLDEVGSMPTSFSNLYSSSGLSPYNPFTRTGWNGPYIDLSKKDIDGDGVIGANEYDILYDAWGSAYVYNSVAETITSNGPDKTNSTGDDIVVNIR